MKFLGSTETKITKDENGKSVSHLESCIHLFLINCLVNYQICDQKILKLQQIIKLQKSEFWYIEVWLSDQNSEMLEMEDKTNTTLVIN